MAQKSIQPIGNKLIVLPIDRKEEVNSKGIIIPETANANLTEGVVVEVADELANKNLAKVGDTVIYSSGSGVGCFYKGKPHVWLTINDVWGFVTK